MLSEQCIGSDIYNITTYLIIDNATRADAGTYVVEIIFGSINPITLQVNISVVVGMYILCMHVLYVNVCAYTKHCATDPLLYNSPDVV